MIRCQLVMLISLLVMPATLAAQGARHATFQLRSSAPPRVSKVGSSDATARNPALLVLGGVLGGVAGGLAGGFGGAAIEQWGGCRGSEQCGLHGGILGGVAGIAVSAPLGVHIANGSRGRGGVAGMLLGSTSQQVLSSALCPVIVARSPEEDGVAPAR